MVYNTNALSHTHPFSLFPHVEVFASGQLVDFVPHSPTICRECVCVCVGQMEASGWLLILQGNIDF